MKASQQIRLKSQTGSAVKQKIKLSSINQGVNPQNAYQSAIKGGSITKSNNGNSISNERHVSFDRTLYHSTAATIGQRAGSGLAGIRPRSPINAQVSNAYQSISDENQFDNIPVKLNSLNEEYKKRQMKMDDRLKQEIENHSVAIVTKNTDKQGVGTTVIKSLNIKKAVSPLHNNDSYLNIQGVVNSGQDQTQKFFRSQRSVAMRIKDTYENQVQILETDKLSLIQKLNDSLLQLDKLNQEKATLSNELIEILKFVREMQRETQKGEDLGGVVSDDLKAELRSEKELSHQLKEDLKAAEVERVRILQRIHELSHLTQDGEIRQNDMNVNFKVKARTYGDIQDELKDIIEKIRINENDVDRLNATIYANKDTIRQLKDKIDMTIDEKRNLHNKIALLQDRYDEAINNYQKERHDDEHLQSRHIRLISTNILFETLEELYRKNLQLDFNLIRFTGQSAFNKKLGFRKLRKLVKSNRTRRLKRFLYNWFTLALKPMRSMKQQYLLSIQMKKNNPLLFAFSKWINAYHIKQAKTHKIKQVILQMLQSKNDYHQRVEKHYFIRWRDVIKMNNTNKNKLLLKKIIKKHKSTIQRYFSRWLSVSQELENQVQLNGMAQRFAFKKYLGQLFNNWRIVSIENKAKRISNLNRVWKNMKIYTFTKKQMRGQTWSILREEKKRTENLIKSCFDAMRQHKEQEKLVRITDILNQGEVPLKIQANRAIQEISAVNKQRQRDQGIKTIAKCFGKQLNQYFVKWAQYTSYHRDLINKNMKQIIIKVYLQHLREAFTSWIKYKGEAMIQFQSDEINQEEQLIAETQAMVKQSQIEIEEKQNKQKSLGSKQIRKIMNNLVFKRQQELFIKWKMNIDQANFTLGKADLILKKLNRRQKRQCFDRFLNKVKDIKLEELYNGKVRDYRQKILEKTQKKVFKGILMFSQEYLKAKNYLKRLLSKLDISLKESALKKWLSYRQLKDEKRLKQDETQKTQNIKELGELIGDKNLHASDQINEIQYLDRRVVNNSFRRVKLGFQRYLQQNSEYGFKKWVKYCSTVKRQQVVLQKCMNHQFLYTQERAFKKWKEQLSFETQFVIIENITHEEKKINKIENEINLKSKMHGMSSDQCQNEIESLQNLQQQYMKKHQNCLQALISKVDNKDFVSKQRYILLQWFNFVQQRKKCIKILENGIQKTLWQDGFQAIKRKSNLIRDQRQKQKMTNALVIKYNKIKTRFAFGQWRTGNEIIIKDRQNDFDKQLRQNFKNHSQLKAVIKERVQEQLVENLNHIKSYDVFIAWRNISKLKKQLKAQTAAYQSEVYAMKISTSLQKWSNRANTTRRFRHIKHKIDRVYNKKLTQDVFDKLHEQKNKSKDFMNSLGSLASIIDRIYAKQSFNKLKLESEANQFKSESTKLRGSILLGDRLSLILRKRQSQILNDIKVISIQNEKLSQGQKAVIKYYFIRKIRDYFNTWRYESDRKEVARYMNEEGPIALQSHIFKKMIYNLKQFAIDDGIEREQVEQVILNNRRQSIKGIEKSVCRLFCYNEKLYLLPKCLDRWKQWVKLRKQYKKSMSFLNKFVDPKLSQLQFAFKRWRYGSLERFNQLSMMTKPQLALITNRNSENIENLADNLVGADDASSSLTIQRDFLLRRYVGSQRLALAASKAQINRTKQKAISKWIDGNSQQISEEYEDALKTNLMRIQALKERIKNLERSNTDLADQNEDLRIGALDGIEMAKSIDDLTRDREKLSVDLADKVMTIRKLIEDNNNLSIRLSNAQEEAQNLIRVSQIKLGKYSDPIYDDDDDY